MPYTFHPLTPERWPDLEALFGTRGGCGGCWCMWARLSHSDYQKNKFAPGKVKGEPNRRAFRKIVERGPAPGVLAYEGAAPVGWCAIAPRPDCPTLFRSRTLKPALSDPADPAIWAVTCFYVDRAHRRRGLTTKLLQAASDHAARHGARLVEGYPVIPKSNDAPPPFVWTGLPGTFLKAGFVEIARPAPTRPIMQRAVDSARARRPIPKR